MAIFGAILGAVVGRFGGIIAYPFRERSPFVGSWFSYHYTFREGRLELIEETVTIRKGLIAGTKMSLSRIEARNRHDRNEYKGSVTVEGENLLINMRRQADANRILVTIRLQPRIPNQTSVMFGLWMSQDHDHRPAAGMVMLTQTRIGKDEAAVIMKKWYEVRHVGAIRLLASPRNRRQS